MTIYNQLVRGELPIPECSKTLGFELVRFSSDTASIEVIFQAKKIFLNPAGHVQGGFLCAMLDDVMDIAAQIARHSPLAVAGSKEMLNFSRDHAVDESLRYMATWQSGMFQQPDIMEAMTAQQQKRLASYADLLGLPETFEQKKNG